MLDVVLLKIMKYRKDFFNLINSLPKAALDVKTKALLEDFGKYFDKFPDHEEIDLQVFIPCFYRWHPAMNKEQKQAYTGLLRQIIKNVDEGTREGILNDLHELNLATNLANLIEQFDEGNLEDPFGAVVTSHLDTYRLAVGAKNIPWEDTPIEEILKEDMNLEGLKWRLDVLNRSMRPLRGGDFGIIAGRPDTGKTSFLASEVTHLAAQMPEDKNVLWLNNEGADRKIVKRIYQAALDKTNMQLAEWARDDADALREAYSEAVGRTDRIRVVNIQNMHIGNVEDIMESMNPGLVVFDMIDSIRGFGSEARTDQQLEKMYQWGRMKCVDYDCVGMATSQISSDGEGERFPTLSMLKESKTGKQGACDFQLMIGKVNDPAYENSRFIGLPKNKLSVEDGPKDPQAEVFFDYKTGLYKDIEEIETLTMKDEEHE